MDARKKNLLLKKNEYLVEAKVGHSELKGTKATSEGHLWALTGQLNSILLIHPIYFLTSHRNKLLCLFSYFSSNHQTQKGIILAIEISNLLRKWASGYFSCNHIFSSVKNWLLDWHTIIHKKMLFLGHKYLLLFSIDYYFFIIVYNFQIKNFGCWN